MTVEITDKPFSYAWLPGAKTVHPSAPSLATGKSALWARQLFRMLKADSGDTAAARTLPMKPWRLLPEVLLQAPPLQTALALEGRIPGKQASVASDGPAPILTQDGKKGERCMNNATRSQHGGTGSYAIIDANTILHLHVTTLTTLSFLCIYPDCSAHFSQSEVSTPPVATLSPIKDYSVAPYDFYS